MYQLDQHMQYANERHQQLRHEVEQERLVAQSNEYAATDEQPATARSWLNRVVALVSMRRVMRMS